MKSLLCVVSFLKEFTHPLTPPYVSFFSRSIQINEQDDIVPVPYDLCNAGALPKQATSASSDVPPDLVDADGISGDGVDSDQVDPQANEPSLLSMPVLRRLDWQNMLDVDEYSNLEGMTQRKSAAQFKGGLNRRLRRRRTFLSG